VREHVSRRNGIDMSQPGLPTENPAQAHREVSDANVVVTLLSTDDDEPLPQQTAEVDAPVTVNGKHAVVTLLMATQVPHSSSLIQIQHLTRSHYVQVVQLSASSSTLHRMWDGGGADHTTAG
jgi:hypothetical protein